MDLGILFLKVGVVLSVSRLNPIAFGHKLRNSQVLNISQDGQCIGNKDPPIKQLGSLNLFPCSKEKAVRFCSNWDTHCQSNPIHRFNARDSKPPFNFTVYDEFEDVRIVIERESEDVKFLEFFVEAREYVKGKISKERIGTFHDIPAMSDQSYLDKQCHRDACCQSRFLHDVAMHCRRPWDGPNRLVGNTWVGSLEQFSWKIPIDFYGEVIFVGTFITSADTFWTNATSNVLMFEKPGKTNHRTAYV